MGKKGKVCNMKTKYFFESISRGRLLALLLAVLTAVSMLFCAVPAFTVHAEGTKYSVTIRNVDENGDQKAGCDFEIFKKGGSEPLMKFTSDSTAKTVQLEPGDYVLRQTKVTGNYALADDAEFTVEDNGHVQNGETTKKYYAQNLSLTFNVPPQSDSHVYTKSGQKGQYKDINGNIVEWESDYKAPMMKLLNPDEGGIEYIYCFKKKLVGVDNNSKNTARFYSQNSTPELFNKYNESIRGTAESAYQHILGILYSGYPNDGSGLKAKYGLTDRQFYAVTQWSIWYHTDSVSYQDSTKVISNKPDGDEFTDNWTENMKSAYKELREKTYADSSKTVEFFTTSDKFDDGRKYQNMIGARFVEKQQTVTVSNAPKLAVNKIDNNGNAVKGADLKIREFNSSGTGYIEMDGMEWTTDGTAHYVNTSKFTPNHRYRLEETKAPDGYYKAGGITFTIDANYNIYVSKYVNGNTRW